MPILEARKLQSDLEPSSGGTPMPVQLGAWLAHAADAYARGVVLGLPAPLLVPAILFSAGLTVLGIRAIQLAFQARTRPR
ncbi:MAG: hypothetical protein IRZ00_05840 [Gemmatimonadetes bacterium]|nr:hypothetical protein [Gemmatimonadota bacterium]